MAYSPDRGDNEVIQNHYSIQQDCRVCGETLAEESVKVRFDALPIAGAYIRETRSKPDNDPVAPFTVASCPGCGLVQLHESLLPDFYHSYQFVSTVAESYVEHLKRISDYLLTVLPAQASITEIGSNDGTLLRILKDRGCQVEGFEPARAPAETAINRGVNTHNTFFSAEAAATADLQHADAIIVRHVLEHIDDFTPIFEGINMLAGEACKLIVEVPDLQSTIEENLYSNFYHPHPCYFDLETLGTLLFKHGWSIQKQGIVDIFGGSLIVEASRQPGPSTQFTALTELPAEKVSISMLDDFMASWKSNIKAAQSYFFDQSHDDIIVGYGAAERTFSYIGTLMLDTAQIECIYDRNEALNGLALPGSRIPIRSAETIAADKPDVVVIFASSYEDEIVAQLRQKLPAETRFVSLKSPIPKLLTG